MANNWNITTDDYNIYEQHQGDAALPGTPVMSHDGEIQYDPTFFPMPTPLNPSTMDYDENNTGPMTDFWSNYPIRIDINGDVFYYNQNTGINLRGPAGLSNIRFDDLTPEQKASLKGADGANGANGTNGRDGADGANGLSAYECWLQDNGWLDHPEEHPISDFYAYIAQEAINLVVEGTGTGSLILNYRGTHNTAGGAGSVAAGDGTAASGNYSFTIGKGTLAGFTYQTAIGSYNENKSTNLFEVGNGDSILRSNAFEVSSTGDITAGRHVYDYQGRKLADLDNKVDKIPGKGLSKNDFNDSYKQFIDTYTLETTINPISSNPVTSAAIYSALAAITAGTGKPTQSSHSTNDDMIFSYVTTPNDGIINELYYSTGLKFNPYKNVLKTDANTSTYSNVIALGTGLSAASNNQTLFGRYNATAASDVFAIGNGTSNADRSNLLHLNASGNLYITGHLVEAGGVTLADKQNVIVPDPAPVSGGTSYVTSGGIYDYLIAKGMDSTYGFPTYGSVSSLNSAVTTLQQTVVSLQNQINAIIAGANQLTDDLYPDNVYTYGIENDQFYIKLNDTEEPEEDNNEEEEGE